MSLSSSPPRSPAGSLTSSPASQLTPRSKVRAMLSAFDDDDDSDKENAHSRPKLSGKSPTRKDIPQKAHEPHESNPRVPFHDVSSDDEGSQEERRISEGSTLPPATDLAPMGTAQEPITVQSGADKTSDDSDSDNGNAYERVRRQLLLGERKSPNFTRKERRIKREDRSKSAASTPMQSPRSRKTLSPPSLAPSPTYSPSGPDTAASGLFVSPTKPPTEVSRLGSDASDVSEADAQDNNHAARNRLQAVVARKREEREAKERAARRASSGEEEEAPRVEPKKRARQRGLALESEDDSDEQADKKLTQQARPTRKASKKAVEEMNRETQRMSRNMQLTHEARTKTKFTTADLFKKLNFRQPKPTSHAAGQLPSHSSSSGAPSSDVERTANGGTPPSSPPSRGISPPKRALAATTAESFNIDTGGASSEDELPTVEQLTANAFVASSTTLQKQAGNDLAPKPAVHNTQKPSLRKLAKSAKPLVDLESDDDLEIIKADKPSRIAAFNNLPAKGYRETHSLHALKALAHLNDHRASKAGLKNSLTPGELKFMLQRRAKDQAMLEKAEKIQALRDKGVMVQTEEEREGEQLQLENMLDKARLEADELAKKEKEARKRDGKEGEGDGLPDSDDEDEDYQGSDDGGDVELSGSDEEQGQASGSDDDGDCEADDEDDEVADPEEDEEDEVEATTRNPMLDDEAGEADEGEQEGATGEDMIEDDNVSQVSIGQDESTQPKDVRSKSRRKTIIESEDEDEEANAQSPRKTSQEAMTRTPKASIADAFGFAKQKSPAMGLSQIFGGTMAESQTQADQNTPTDDQQDSLAFLRGLPPIDMATIGAEYEPETQVQDSQNDFAVDSPARPITTQPMFAFETQSQKPYPETQNTQLLEPTQDAGFETTFSPACAVRNSETQGTHSTIETVVLPEDSPAVKPRRRLQRGRPNVQVEASQDDLPAPEVEASDDEQGHNNAFLIMKKAAKKAPKPEQFDKKTSEAKRMFEEQAEESEDEYAGLGGASDDDIQGELDEETSRIVDDTSNEKLNARQVAARYHAQKLAEDEKETSKLYKDITTGGLRRKRGAGIDLLDSDDEDEALSRRRAAKQREFAKMRKALLADEKIGKIAENPKRQAFLQAIADYAEDDETNFLDAAEDSQSQLNPFDCQDSLKALAPTEGNAHKRKHDEYAENAEDRENRPPAHLRRTNKPFRAPPSDIRKTLSEMIDNPDEMVGDSQPAPFNDSHTNDGSRSPSPSIDDHEDHDEDEDELYRAPSPMRETPAPPPQSQRDSPHPPPAQNHNPRRTPAATTQKATIDRLTLRRTASSSLTPHQAQNNTSRLAFAAPTLPHTSSFKIPSLLRRATTNNASNTSQDGSVPERSSSISSMSGANGGALLGGMGKENIKRGGSKKSSVNYYVRETERRRRVDEGERERREGNERVGLLRSEGSHLGGLGGGLFE